MTDLGTPNVEKLRSRLGSLMRRELSSQHEATTCNIVNKETSWPPEEGITDVNELRRLMDAGIAVCSTLLTPGTSDGCLFNVVPHPRLF